MTLNPKHAERMAWHQIYEALKSAGLGREESLARADAFSANFAERVRRYSRNVDAVASAVGECDDAHYNRFRGSMTEEQEQQFWVNIRKREGDEKGWHEND